MWGWGEVEVWGPISGLSEQLRQHKTHCAQGKICDVLGEIVLNFEKYNNVPRTPSSKELAKSECRVQGELKFCIVCFVGCFTSLYPIFPFVA